MAEIIDVDVAGGPMAAYVTQPDNPNGSAVVVLMEAFGVNDHIRAICERFAARGSVAVAPDLYHRQGRLITGDYTDAAAVMPHFATLDTDAMAADIEAAIGTVASMPDVDPARIGVIGFCLGGYGAVLAACRSTPAVAAGFYGAGLAIQRAGSPLVPLAGELGDISCPVLLFYGADDPVIPPAEVAAVRAALASHAIEHEVRVYDGAGHGFFCDARGSYVESAATDAWALVTAAFDRALGGNGT